jgi:hypothetical protein
VSRSLRRLVTTLAAATALLVPVASAGATVPSDWAGVNAQWLFPAMPQSSWDIHVDEMARTGVKVVRLDAEWRRVEPTAPVAGVHAYDWSFYDRVVTTLARRGIRWYPVVGYSAPWAATTVGEWRSPPASAGEYATYAKALAKRYGPGGAFWRANKQLPQVPVRQWEIWNEENGGYFWPSAPNPAAYADLYVAARAAIRSVDPGARAVVGGLIGKGAGYFLRDMLAARPSATIDAVGLHAYGATVAGAVFWMEDVRNWLVGLGRGSVPIEVTEFGWTTVGTINVAADAVRAANITALLQAAAAHAGIDRMIIHTWVSREQWPTVGEDWFGIVHPDGSGTQSSAAFGATVRALSAPPLATARVAKTRARRSGARCSS